MNAIKNVVILVLSALLVAVQCTGRDSENPDENPSKDDRTSVTITTESKNSGKIVFSGSNTPHAGVVSFWESKGDSMLRQQMDQGIFSVLGVDGTEHPMVGFKVPRETLAKLMELSNNQIPEDFSGIYLMPAVRPCDLNSTDPKYTIMVGALLENGSGDYLDTESVEDFFKPCPDICTTIKGFDYTKDSFSLEDGKLQPQDSFKADTCLRN